MRRRRHLSHDQMLTGKIDRILDLVERIAREAGISPKPPVEPLPPPSEPPQAGVPTMNLLEPE